MNHGANARDHGWAFVIVLLVGYLVASIIAMMYFHAVLDTIGG